MITAVQGHRPYLLLALLCLALYLPGIASLPPTDRDEARFAQASRQMLESGDFVRIRFQDQARNKKPAGTYWLQAASVAVFSNAASSDIWPYRLPSVLGALVAVWLTFLAGTWLFDRHTAFLGAALMATALGLVVEAHIAKADALLLAAVVAAQAALARIYMAAREGHDGGAGPALAFWAALGVGVLIKGPVAPLVAGLTLLTLKLSHRKLRLWRALRPLTGVPLALVIVAPWFIAVDLATDGAFISDAVRGDLLPKLLGGQEAHGFWPGYYLLLSSITFWPGALFAVPALIWAWGRRREAPVLFCLAWLVPTWLVFELVPTKLPHYVLPLYPALALLTARAAVEAVERGLPRLGAFESRIAIVVWALVALAVAAALAALPAFAGGDWNPWTVVPVLATLIMVAYVVFQAWRGSIERALYGAVVGAVVLFAVAFQFILPATDGLWIGRATARMIAVRSDTGSHPVVAASGFHEPSLVFHLGTRTRLVSPGRAAADLASGAAVLALIGEPQRPAFLAALVKQHQRVHRIGAVRGFNYSRGRWVTLTLYKRVKAAR